MELFNTILNTVEKYDPEIVLIHSDIMKGFPVKFASRNTLPVKHIELLAELFKDIPVWMPTFNYDFCRGGDYSVMDSPSQLGVISEYFRKQFAEWRTKTPVFSFSGTGKKPELDCRDIIDPFNESSAFHLLNSNASLIVHYGSELKHTTLIHYIEKISNKLFYRYDKIFVGNIIDENRIKQQVKLKYHVRPMGYHLDYNWKKLYKELKANQILIDFGQEDTRIIIIKTKELVDFWVRKMEEDTFYLLDDESKEWIIPKIDKLGRAFVLSDFE